MEELHEFLEMKKYYLDVIKDKDKRITKLEKELNSKNMLCENYNCGLNKKIKQLQQELAELKERAIVPKFKKDDYVYALFTQTEIYKGQIDAFDYYTNSYLVFPNEDVGNEWIEADKVFKSKEEAKKKLQELRGGE